MEYSKVEAKDQHWPLVIESRESSLDPCAHGALEYLVQAGSLFHGVVAVYFGEIGVMEAFLHDG